MHFVKELEHGFKRILLLDALSPFRYGSSASPFGGLGSLRGAAPPSAPGLPPHHMSADPFGLNRPPYPTSTASPSTSSSTWPLKSESSLLSNHEKQRREAEEKRLREDRERKQREKREREKLHQQQLRLSRGESPSHRPNGDPRARSPLRHAAGLLPPIPGLPNPASSLVKREELLRPASALDMRSPSLLKRESDNEVTVISDKEGNTTIAHQSPSTNGRASVHSLERPLSSS